MRPICRGVNVDGDELAQLGVARRVHRQERLRRLEHLGRGVAELHALPRAERLGIARDPADVYLRIGVELNGIRHWRAYSLTSDPDHPDGLVVDHGQARRRTGKMSPYFTRQAEPGSMVFLGDVEGELPPARPAAGEARCSSAPAAGSRRSGACCASSSAATARRRLPRPLRAHARRTSSSASDLRLHERRLPGYTLHEHLTPSRGRLSRPTSTRSVPDWRDRETFLSGPARHDRRRCEEHWEARRRSRPAAHRALPADHRRRGDADVGRAARCASGSPTSRRPASRASRSSSAARRPAALLPFGCRMGICHTCVGKLQSGQVRDLRTGEVHGEQGEMVRTCVNAPEGHVEIDL